MKAATLFSGIGAPEAARPDWQWLWAAEIDRFPAAVHAQRHGCPNLGDVSADDFCDRAASIGRPDVLVFGSPCQSFSVAGKRLGLDDHRGNLALVALGIAARLRPEWLVFENVPGLLSSGGGRDFGAFLGTVEQCGYLGAYRVLDAQFFGVPQRRRRVFAVFRLGDWRGPAAVLFEPESLRGDPPPRRKAGQGASTLPSRSTAGGGLGTDFDCDGGLIAHALRADGFDASEDGTGRGTPLVADWPVQVAPTLNAAFGDKQGLEDQHALSGAGLFVPAESETLIAFSAKDYGADAAEIAPTLRAGGHAKSHANAGVMPAVASATSAVRRLTPRECERLQGFPDDTTAITYRGKPAADGPRYKALGNSMAVPVLRWILTRLEQVAAIQTQREAA